MQQETDCKITGVQEKSQGPEKWKLAEIIVCYSNEYAVDITDILTKPILQIDSQQINRCTLG